MYDMKCVNNFYNIIWEIYLFFKKVNLMVIVGFVFFLGKYVILKFSYLFKNKFSFFV